jgi:hypothetical protein
MKAIFFYGLVFPLVSKDLKKKKKKKREREREREREGEGMKEDLVKGQMYNST